MRERGLSIDFFAGGGGASLGHEKAFGFSPDIAVNHDPDAIAMHAKNHPNTLHITEDIFSVDLLKYTKGRHVSFIWASPDCTSHSKAKGSKPVEKGLRILPWAVYKHARKLLPDVIIMENVEEIQKWGPLDENGYPIKEKQGEEYQRFIVAMQALEYTYDFRVLVAADYGAPTTRERWYAVFRRDGKSIKWPEPTHSKCPEITGLTPWIPASTIIDWSDLGTSIFERKKELAENTQLRIARGIKKFIIDDPNPYILEHEKAASFLIQYHTETKKDYVRGQSLNEPLKTIDTSNRYGLVTAFITKFYKTGIGQSLNEPLHTVTTSPGHFGLVSAFLIKYYGQGIGQSLNNPLGTIVTKDRFGLVIVMIKGKAYQIADIRLRMLKPEELKLGQGFTEDYIINFKDERTGRAYPIAKQVARIGNSVVPIMAEKLDFANCPYLKQGDRMPNLMIDYSKEQLRFA